MSTPVSIALNAAGIVAGLSSLSREVVFYDQEKYLKEEQQAQNMNAVAKTLFKANPLADHGKIFGGIPFFRSAVMRLGVDQRARMCDQPLEAGAMVTDHKVRMPRTITCQFVCPSFLAGYTIGQLEQYYQNSAKIVIEAPTGVYLNMILEAEPANMTPENVSRPIYELRFREVLIVKPQAPGIDSTGAVDPADGDTKKMTVWSDLILDIPTVGNVMDNLSQVG